MIKTRTSRRTVVKGAAWAVPAVSLVSATPAYAISNATCSSYTWTSLRGYAIPTGSYSQASSDGSGSAVTVAASKHGNWNYTGQTTYSPLDLTSSGGSLILSGYVTTGVTPTLNDYGETVLAFPTTAGGPISFQICGLDSYTRSRNSTHAQYFTDMVQVSQSGNIITPSALSNATVDKTTSWTVATGTTSGCATYTVADPAVGPVTIKLGNAYGSKIPVSDRYGNTHPDQAVTLSEITCGKATPPAQHVSR